VAALPDGGFVVSKFLDQRDNKGREHLMAGQVNGTVYRWRIGHGFEQVPGTQLPGDNGLAVTKDGQWLFVNAYGSREVVKVPLSGNGAARVARVDFNPDNLRWTPDGRLFVTGQFRHLGAAVGQDGWETVILDPDSMRTLPFLRERGRPAFDDASSTVQVGSTVWIGSFRSDRVAWRTAP
jgi:sugar lactone lactonase YvrE